MNFQEATKHIQTVDYSFLQDHEEAVLNKMRKTATPAVLKMVDGFLINYTVYGNKYHTSYVAAMADESGNWADCESKSAIIAFAKQFVVAAEVVKSEIGKNPCLTGNEKSINGVVKLTNKNRHCGFFITVSHVGKLKYYVELHHDKYDVFSCEFKNLSEAAKSARNYAAWTESQFEDEIKYSSIVKE